MRAAILRVLPLLTLVLVAGLGVVAPAAAASGATSFPGLQEGQRVVDETGDSLTTAQTTDLEQRLDALVAVGADPVVYVRARDADPDETLDQVEALQQAWVSATGADEDTAVAILVNRNPDDEGDARAGVYVGETYQDGNVPSGEQEAIVEDALVPPLRDGDVHASLVAGVDRLTSDVRDGQPTTAFQDWSAGAAATWVPWVLLALAAIGAVVAGRTFGRRSRLDDPHAWSGQPTVTRPSDLHPAVGAALATGSPQASAVPAVVLDLAARGALDVEQETAGGTFSQATAQVRLLDRSLVRSDVDAAVWDQMAALADDAVVSSKALAKVAANSGPVDEVVRAELVRQGWWDEAAPGARNALAVVGAVAGILLAVGAVIGASGAEPLVLVGLLPMLALAVTAFVLVGAFPRLSGSGLAAARPWRDHRVGLELAAKDDGARVDLDAVLPDVIAMTLGQAWKKRLEAATDGGQVLRALSPTSRAAVDGSGMLPWVVFPGAFTSSSGTGTVSGVSSGGGGGAAGST